MAFDINNLLKAEVYPHPVSQIELIETHISWVVLTGEFAYKIKKPVNFGFLDFSTLAKRKEYCEQEIKLNKRLAPEIYLQVVSISGSAENPRITDSEEAVFEYAVKMKQFPQSAQLDNFLSAGNLQVSHLDAIAEMIANFHQHTAIADQASTYGSPEVVFKPVEENITLIQKLQLKPAHQDLILEIQQWCEKTYSYLKRDLLRRKKQGFIRECHGDMHLRNLVWIEGKPMAFDCIEFNDELRWIDVISEVAFLLMDLQDRKQHKLANRFLNSYLEQTGDYAGLKLMSFYLCYRAMVRAKVDALRIAQELKKQQATDEIFQEFDSYLQLAHQYTQASQPRLILMRGMSASGKSTVSQQLVDEMGAIRIRSDRERKRLFDIDEMQDSATEIDRGIYSTEASEKTYAKLLALSEAVLKAGYTVIVDAAFLKFSQREPFEKMASRSEVETTSAPLGSRINSANDDALAKKSGEVLKKPSKSGGVSFTILEVTASPEELRKRIMVREGDISDANLAVLEHQIAHWQPLQDQEMSAATKVNTEEALNITQLINEIDASI